MKKSALIFFVFLLLNFSIKGQLRVGDPGVQFDMNKMDANYPQMQQWITAGVIGGIPFIDDQIIKATVSDGDNTADINNAINTMKNQGGGAVFFENGNYNINAQVKYGK